MFFIKTSSSNTVWEKNDSDVNQSIIDSCEPNDTILIIDSIDESHQLEMYVGLKTISLKVDRSKQSIITEKNLTDLFDSNDIKEKFDKIIIKNILEFSENPSHILGFLKKFLSPDGLFLIVFHNVSFFKERIKFLNGDFFAFEQIANKNLQRYFSLSTILYFFTSMEYSLEKVSRIKKNIQINKYSDLNEFTVSDELLDSIKRDPESAVSHYVILINPSKINNVQMRKWLSEFPTNLTTDRLKEWFDYYKYYLPNIQSDSNFAQKIKEQNQHIQELQSRLNSIENSFTWKFLRKLDKFKKF